MRKLFVLLAVLLWVLVACGKQSAVFPTPTQPKPSPTPTTAPPPTAPPPTAPPPTAPPPTPTPTIPPEPTHPPEPTAIPVAQVVFTQTEQIPPDAVHAVDLLGAWVNAGVPEKDTFTYTGYDGNTYQATFAQDILPLFTQPNVWYPGAPACTSCHHANLENAYHELDLSSYEGILLGADRLSKPPGVPILGQSAPGATDFNWNASALRTRLRNNRMPPGMPFDITEANRDGPPIQVNGTEVLAVDLIKAWVEAGAPEKEPFGDYKATFEANILPLFTQPGVWYPDAPACTSCHHANLENAYHELDLSSYEGILLGADRLSKPPGVPILGQSASGATDFNWNASALRARLRNNRMPPGMPFDITEANRDGPWVRHGQVVGGVSLASATGTPLQTGDCHIEAVSLLAAWVEAGAPATSFPFTSRENEKCIGEFELDILPLFTQPNVWYPGAPACTSCHHANLENAYHELDLSSYEGILLGADRLSEPPGVPILGQSASGATDFNWNASRLRARLRDNRMPPGMPFDITEANRDGPPIQVNGTEVLAVDLIKAWVEAGAPEKEPFGDYKATFEANILPLFTQPGVWYPDAPACTSCHHANLENAYHELDLSSYEGILLGADRLSKPPGVPILGQSASGATDFNWNASKLRARLRNNRMPPGMPFDITEANRDGPIVQVGYLEGKPRRSVAIEVDLSQPPDLATVDALVTRGGCKVCHTIPAFADAVGVLGPPWCEVTKEFQEGKLDLAFIYQSIVDPNAAVEEGFPQNLMPTNFGQLFTEDELKTLVAFIATQKCD